LAREANLQLNLPTTQLLLAASPAKPDIVRRFLAWAQSADADARADGANALARAYLHSDLTGPLRAEAELALTALTDDPAILVRRTLSEALCRSRDAPRAVILALAADEMEAAAPVLQHSPALTDPDLVDCVKTGGLAAQIVLARRPNLPPLAKAALAEMGERDAVIALIGNVESDCPTELLGLILDRFGDDTIVREAMLERPSLPAGLRARIAVAAAKDLAIEASQWMAPSRAERVAREARDQAICTIASFCLPEERAQLTKALRVAGALTPALLMRSLLGGDRALLADTLAELSGLPVPRVTAFIFEPHGEGFAALAHRAGLKRGPLLAIRAALAAINAHAPKPSDRLNLSLVQKVIHECDRLEDASFVKVRTLLWRFAAEAAKAEAKTFAREATASAADGRLPPLLEFLPINDDEDRAPKLIVDVSRGPVNAPILELSASSMNADEDAAPRVELPLEFVVRLADAA
jgi:uncharacterized protein (DUF2336 family)